MGTAIRVNPHSTNGFTNVIAAKIGLIYFGKSKEDSRDETEKMLLKMKTRSLLNYCK